MVLFCSGIAVLLAGALCAFILARRDQAANALGPLAAALGSGLCLAAGALALAGDTWSLTLAWAMPGASFRLALDPLSGLFLLPGGILGLASAWSGHAALKHHDGGLGPHWGFFNLTLAASAVVFAARDSLLFLLAWEVMSVASFFCITLEDREERVRSAGWLYFVAAHLGAAALLALFLVLGSAAGAQDFAAFSGLGLTGGTAAAVFLLALAGFGSKAGFFPMHVWLPEAHPAAPSHISAYLSGALIKAGLYGFLRVLTFLGAPPTWWGGLCLILGLAGALLGILLALGQANLKRLLAYSSVENMGIMLLGVGVGLLGLANGAPLAAGLGFAGALLHMLNHCLMKGLLFLAAGSVLHGAGTVRMPLLGGLLKRMPATGTLFCLGALAICGLPPGNGFLSELLLYVAAAGWAKGLGPAQAALLWAAVVGLALTGGLAAFAMVRAFGLTFLGEPRSGVVDHAHEPGPGEVGPVAALALLCGLAAAAAPLILAGIWPAAAQLAPVGDAPLALGRSLLGATVAALAALLLLVLAAALARRLLLRGRSVAQAPTWGCGYTAPTPRMQYSPASFSAEAESMARQATGYVETRQDPTGYFPGRSGFASACRDRVLHGLFGAPFARLAQLCDQFKVIQHGRTQFYILYIFAALLGVLAWRVWLP
jgi:formate hydrogenlyase subunit 3/multisubunit Na+/H+ antiporter MnhD subunit